MPTRSCPVCFRQFDGETYDARAEAVEKHVRDEHPSFEIRLERGGEVVGYFGPYQGKLPDAVAKLDGQSLDEVKSTSSHPAVAELKQRRADHERKAVIAVSPERKADHDPAGLIVRVYDYGS